MKGSIRQRTPGSYELTIDLGRDALGKRRRKFVTIQGTKSTAQRELRRLLSTLDRGIDLPSEKITIRQWLDRWLQDVIVPHRRQATAGRYRSIIALHIAPAIGHIELAKLGPAHVHAMEARLLGSGMSPQGVQLVHVVLSGAVKHALRMELIQRNPVSLVSPPPSARREIPPPDIGAVRRALELARDEGHHLHAAIHLIAYTGLRRGEALGLSWSNVDLDSGHVSIEASLIRAGTLGLILQPPKTHSGRRIVDLDEGTANVLAQHRAEQDRLKDAMRGAYLDRGRVFADETGRWINPMQLTRAIKRLGARVGHPQMTVRSLRHFHASVALQTGQNIVVVSKRLGHANVSITSDIYAHALPGWQQQTADAFADAMKKGS